MFKSSREYREAKAKGIDFVNLDEVVLEIEAQYHRFVELTEGDEAVSDDMGDAIVFSMPIRNVVSFGLCDKEELIKKLEELNSR